MVTCNDEDLQQKILMLNSIRNLIGGGGGGILQSIVFQITIELLYGFEKFILLK
jgi:hypothetical protein